MDSTGLSSSITTEKTATTQGGYIGSTPVQTEGVSVHTSDTSDVPINAPPVDMSVRDVESSVGSTTAPTTSKSIPKKSSDNDEYGLADIKRGLKKGVAKGKGEFSGMFAKLRHK
jgi:hypothetical protein